MKPEITAFPDFDPDDESSQAIEQRRRLRDALAAYFATQSLNASYWSRPLSMVAKEAYNIADEMLKARDTRK